LARSAEPAPWLQHRAPSHTATTTPRRRTGRAGRDPLEESQRRPVNPDPLEEKAGPDPVQGSSERGHVQSPRPEEDMMKGKTRGGTADARCIASVSNA